MPTAKRVSGRWRLYGMMGDEQLPRAPGCYAIYLDGRLCYIGQTVNVHTRIHLFHKIDWSRYSNTVETPWGWFRTILIKYRPSRKYGDWAMAEARLIRRLRPAFNRRGYYRRVTACA